MEDEISALTIVAGIKVIGDCWCWTGTKGLVTMAVIRGRVWELTRHQEIPARKKITTTCLMRSCIRPSHLMLIDRGSKRLPRKSKKAPMREPSAFSAWPEIKSGQIIFTEGTT